MTTDRLAHHLRAQTPQMLDELGALTAVESFSSDTVACAGLVEDLLAG